MAEYADDVAKVADYGPLPDPALADRRAPRVRTVYRRVQIISDADRGLALCRDISDGGMRLQLKMGVEPNDRVEVAFSDSDVVAGRVIWRDGDECGVAFAAPIDSAALLGDTAAETRKPGSRAPRLEAELAVRISAEGEMVPAEVKDISQSGMKVLHHGALRRDLSVIALLGAGNNRRAVVRWTKGDMAGLQFLEPLSVEDLGSVRALGRPSLSLN